MIARKSIQGLILAQSILWVASDAWAERYLVLFKDRQTMRGTAQQLRSSQAINLQSLGVRGQSAQASVLNLPSVQVLGELDHLAAAVVDSDNTAEMQRLEKSGAVELVEKEFFYPAPKPVLGQMFPKNLRPLDAVDPAGTIASKMPWGIKSVRAPQAWPLSGAGEGVRVLVLDTGIDRDHPAVKANFEEGMDFVDDNNQPYEYADKIGHGTHVAGTIAAVQMADGFVGVAPKAKILAGRVCGDRGCSSIAITRGVNWAIAKKVDLVNMSLGGPMASAGEVRALKSADAAGITVVAATGNDGKGKVSYPAALPTSIAVGAIDDTMKKAVFSNWGPEVAVVAPGVNVVSAVPVGTGRESKVTIDINGSDDEVASTSFVGSPEIKVPVKNQVVLAGLGKNGEFPASVAGKFALVQRGEIPFAEKVANAIAANAAGVIIFNHEPGLIQGSITQDGSTVAVPVVMIEKTSGDALKAELMAGKMPMVSMATIATDYAAFAGTSMASPHVAGVVALMKAANKSLAPQQVKAILRQTAMPLGPNPNNEFGAGQANAEMAVQKALGN